MAFLNASVLIFGSLLIAAPIALHLMMRRKPRQLVFPALRFVKERREQNQRRLRLRQWLLLLLRCAAIVALAAALARPSVDSATVGDWLLTAAIGAICLVTALAAAVAFAGGRGKLLSGALAAVALILLAASGFTAWSALRQGSQLTFGDEEAPVAAALVFDTAPRMAYRFENRTRLEQAQETAQWLLPQLPAGSEVAVLDARPGPVAFAVDRAVAQKTVERLETTGVPRPLPEVIADALTLAARSEKPRKEIYVFTDLTTSAWTTGESASLRSQLENAGGVLVYLFDIGVTDPQNTSLGELSLSAERLSPGGELELSVRLDAVGAVAPRAVELCLEAPDPALPVLRDGRLVVPAAVPRQRKTTGESDKPTGRSVVIRFAPLPKLPLGVHQGFVRLEGQDALPVDDVRYFTVEVRPPLPVLVAAPPSADPSFLVEALAPYEFRVTGQAQFACETISQDSLAGAELDRYAVVCLLDPTPLAAGEWAKLAEYARQGGGVAICLGRNAQNYAAFNGPAAQSVLPGKIVAPFIWNAPQGDLFLAATGAEHPILAPFRTLATTTPWQDFPIYKHWVVDASAPESAVVARFGNNKPAIVERPLGKGRVAIMTTPLSDPLNVRGREPWNQLPTGFDPWPFVILANELTRYLAGDDDGRLNYLAGETAELPNRVSEQPERYELFPPAGDPHEVTAQDGKLTVRFLDLPGAWRLKGNRGGPVIRGFCANLAPGATDLTRATAAQLDVALGEDRYQLAKTRDEFRRKIGLARQGREFYPFLLVILAFILGLEFVLANRFYAAES